MGVHHAWGRTLKDVFQRYKALRGYDQRYQNGFDCQGLWVEVEVEKALGLNSKREIEEYGLAEFAARCRERVAEFAEVITEQSKRLGMWMDWDNDYYTFSDTNIEYIWRFLKEVHGRGWLYQGHRSTQWCPRCGTSLSQHEQAGEENYEELEHPSLYVRFPLKDREGESLVVWTTTPWTLPANVAAAVRPDAEYGLRGRRLAARRDRTASTTASRAARSSSGSSTRARSTTSPAQEGVVHRVIPWDEVALDEGTGIVHIAPGRRRRGLRALARARPAGARADRRGRPLLPGLRRRSRGCRPTRSRSRSSRRCASAACWSRRAGSSTATRSAGAAGRRSSSASSTTGSSRVDEIRAAAARRERDGRVDAAAVREADGRLAPQHGRLEHLAQALLRPAAARSTRARAGT